MIAREINASNDGTDALYSGFTLRFQRNEDGAEHYRLVKRTDNVFFVKSIRLMNSGAAITSPNQPSALTKTKTRLVQEVLGGVLHANVSGAGDALEKRKQRVNGEIDMIWGHKRRIITEVGG